MRQSPLRLLVSSYGLAATLAVLASYAGAGFGASLLLFWLGGAAVVFAPALLPGVSVSQVARRYDVNANMVFKWLRDPRFKRPEDELPSFLPVGDAGRIRSTSRQQWEKRQQRYLEILSRSR